MREKDVMKEAHGACDFVSDLIPNGGTHKKCTFIILHNSKQF